MVSDEQIAQDLVTALKAGDSTRVSTLRMLRAAAKNAQVARGRPLTEAEYLDVVAHQAKMRREAEDAFQRGGREEQAAQERAELSILQTYLPAALSEEEIRAVLQEAIDAAGASGTGDLGRVMGRAMPSLRGRADGSVVTRLAREMLAG